jgi:co-chaperonin GroES (HSP10)
MNKSEYISEHFPDVEIGFKPAGNQIVVQLRQLKEKTSGGIVLARDTRDVNKDNTQVGRVIALGQIAYKHRETGDDWKEGAWARLGDIVIIPMWGGFRFELPQEDGSPLVFVVLEDYQIKGTIESNFESFDKVK